MASLVHKPGIQPCLIMQKEDRHPTFSLFIHFWILCRVATCAPEFVVPFSVILTRVACCLSWKTVAVTYSAEEAVLNFLCGKFTWFHSVDCSFVSGWKWWIHPSSVCFFLCSGLSCCGTNHEDFWISQALKYHVHTLSLIQSCNHDSLEVTRPYELFYQAVKAELVYSLYGSLSRLLAICLMITHDLPSIQLCFNW